MHGGLGFFIEMSPGRETGGAVKKRRDSECHTVNLNKPCKYNRNQPVFLRIAKAIALTKISTCSVNATEVERATF